MDFELEGYKAYIWDYAAVRLTRSKGGHYCCPFCNSGTGANHTGALSIDKHTNLWKCFSCHKGGDIFTLHAMLEGIEQGEAIKQVKAMYAGAAVPIRNALPASSGDKNAKPHTFDSYIASGIAAMKGSPAEEYLHQRGFTDESIARFKLGYDASIGGVIIPYDTQNSYYITRKINPVDKNDRFEKPSRTKAGTAPLYNKAALLRAKSVFVVESQLDAITLMQEGAEATVALGSTGYNILLETLHETGTEAVLYICLDNDDAGKKATAELLEKLADESLLPAGCQPLTYADVSADICGDDCKDPNEVLTKLGADALRSRIKAITDEAEEALNQTEGELAIDAFMAAVQTARYEPMPTGIKDIDNAMHGGFMRQSIYFLGAAPGVGKTALAQWIFENMATSGIDCIYLNLEMAREQMLARSLSRISAKRGYKISPVDILQGYKWTDTQREQIEAAAAQYRSTIAQHMIYNPSGVNNSFTSIMSYLEMNAKRAEAEGKPAPVVCIDYLQIIGGTGREEASELVKRIVDGLKTYAVEHKTFVLLVMAHNREANKSGTPSMSSGRDTSAIEYSADAQMALTFTDCIDKRTTSADDVTGDRRQYLTLVFTKGRNGEQGKRVDLHFDGATMTYTQIDSRHTEINTGRAIRL